ncbi:hypothetical protein ACFO7V_03180 [Glutamicibacter bergerei]|uniref:DUF8175 domain-containing protein n=1 Tax=Glutamicibacter bergerei TaxID=256702 RepID=A0ABV9MGW9_9MICC|nr:hypothetical protein [Micrococcaceae bacterium]
MAETDPLGKNWKLWGGILAFIAAVVIVGLVFIRPSTPEPEAAHTVPAPSVPAETVEPSASPTASKSSSGDCPALSTDTTFPNEAPDTEWKRHPAGMLLPVSDSHGPAKMDGDFWRCFSHTPSGAVMSGITLLFDFSSGGVLDAAADSTQREVLFEEWKNAETPAEFPLISGFRVMDSSDQTASIEYLAPVADQYAYTRVNVLWDEKANDWRLDLSSGEPAWDTTLNVSSYTDFN